MLRFRLLGIPFEVTPYFWLGSAILSGNLTGGRDGLILVLLWVLCVFVSIVAHELGHALAARRYGVRPSVALYQFGGLTFLPGARLNRLEHIVVSLAGPAAGGLMYLAAHAARYCLGSFGGEDLLFAPTQEGLLVREALRDLFWINGAWTVFNLLPIQPLDGGQVLRSALGPRLLGVTRMVGGVCAVGCCVLAVLYGQVFIAIFLGYLAYSNLKGETRSLPGVGR